MERPIVTIPRSLMRDLVMPWRIDWRGQPSQVALGGNSGTVYNAFPRWVGAASLHLTPSLVPKWRALINAAQGRVGIFRVPMNNPLGFSWGAAAGTSAVQGTPFSTGARFATGMGMEFEPTALAVGEVPKGSTSMTIDVSPCGIAPKVDQIMSHNDWPFAITAVDEVSGTIFQISVQMPIRATIPAGAEIHMAAYGRFELVDEGQGNAVYDRSMHSRVSIDFREILRR